MCIYGKIVVILLCCYGVSFGIWILIRFLIFCIVFENKNGDINWSCFICVFKIDMKWEILLEYIVVRIFIYLSLLERLMVLLSCK